MTSTALLQDKNDLENGPQVQTERVLRPWQPSYMLLTAVYLATIAVFMSFWFSLRFDIITAIATLFFLYTFSSQFFGWLLLPLMRRPQPVAPKPGWRVGVATTFVPGAEPLEMLEETLAALVAMEYPHDTWVLDEGDDDKVRELCARLGALHFTRKLLPQYQTQGGIFGARTKVGNFNAWLHELGFQRYDIIVGFDPDHVPEPNFLTEVLGYFSVPQIGYVQAAQVYYNQNASFIARGAAEESYAYYSTNQMASYAGGYPIVTGCHHAHRTNALKEVGGFPPHDAEDLLITLLYRTAGWRGVYVPKILARGLTPVDWTGYLTQQLRWARSVLDIKLRQFPRLARHLPPKERILGLLQGLYYLQALWTFVGVLLLCYMLITGNQPEFVSYTTLLYLAPVLVAGLLCELYRQQFFLDPEREGGLHLRARLLRLAKWPYLLLALGEVVRGQKRAYSITNKVEATGKRYMVLRPHLFVVSTVCAAWGVGMIVGHDIHPLLHLSAALMVVLSLGVAWTETWSFPPPYSCRSVSVEHAAGDIG